MCVYQRCTNSRVSFFARTFTPPAGALTVRVGLSTNLFMNHRARHSLSCIARVFFLLLLFIFRCFVRKTRTVRPVVERTYLWARCILYRCDGLILVCAFSGQTRRLYEYILLLYLYTFVCVQRCGTDVYCVWNDRK